MGKCEFDKDMQRLYTLETRIKEPTFLDDSLLKAFVFAFTIHILGTGKCEFDKDMPKL